MTGEMSQPPKSDDGRLSALQQFFLVLPILFGCLVLWGSTVELVEDARLLIFGRETVGIVTEHLAEGGTTLARTSRGPASTTRFRAIVSIETKDGPARIRARVLYGPSSVAPLGSRVAVLYPSGRPEDGQIKGESKSFWLHILTGVLGVALIGAPILVLINTGTWNLSGRRR
jgi:hypothetical protein